MPYYVYRVKPVFAFDKLAQFDAYPDASRHAKALRAAGTAPGERIRVLFAADEQAVEDLLCQVREPAPAGDD
jgi:hypothetical protein